MRRWSRISPRQHCAGSEAGAPVERGLLLPVSVGGRLGCAGGEGVHGSDLSFDVGAFKNELYWLTGSLPGGVALIGQSGPTRGSGPSRLVLVRPAGRPEQLLGALLSVWVHLHQEMLLHGLRAAPPGSCWCSYLGLCCSKRNHCGRHIHRCGEDGGATISVTLAPNPHAVIWTPPAVVSLCDDRRFPQSHRFLTIARRHGERVATAVQEQLR